MLVIYILSLSNNVLKTLFLKGLKIQDCVVKLNFKSSPLEWENFDLMQN